MAKSGSETRQRAMTLSIRVTNDEKQALRARADAYGLSMGRFVRLVCLNQPLPKATRFTREQAGFVAFVVASTASMMTTVRRIEGLSCEDGALREIEDEAAQIRLRCFEMLGRAP